MDRAVVYDSSTDLWFEFGQAQEVIRADRLEEVASAIKYIEKRVEADGLSAVGFISYQAAPAFNDAFFVQPSTKFPLLYFGLFATEVASHRQLAQLPLYAKKEQYSLSPWQASLSALEYEQALARIKLYLARGDSYQVNFSYCLRAKFSGAASQLFSDLLRAQRPAHGVYLETKQLAVCSASPELFFRLDRDRIVAKPMKGTLSRGRTLAEDLRQRDNLVSSNKIRTENLIIVDLVRNDLAKVAQLGSVVVPALFEAEKYPSLWQMTSSVAGITHASLLEILAALFPSASITGAPKARTMEIIAALESWSRGIYTGTVGYLFPGRRYSFNVAIRTAVIDRSQSVVEYGTGGGVVWDSLAEQELEECSLKSSVALLKHATEFSLLETILWCPKQGYFLLQRHLDRLAASASYFDYPFNRDEIWAQLSAWNSSLAKNFYKLRLLLSSSGEITIQAEPLAATSDVLQLGLSRQAVNRDDVFLFHKTTKRGVYQQALAENPGLDDVLLFNELGEVTESCFGNIVCPIAGELITPKLGSALLPGVYRSLLLDHAVIREGVIALEQLRLAPFFWVINSVRAWQKAMLIV